MQNRLHKSSIEYHPIELDPVFPISSPSHIVRGDISPDAPHVHDCFEIGYCFEGVGLFTVEDKILSYDSGDAVVINHTEVHQAVSLMGNLSTWSFINVDPIALLTGFIQAEGYPLETASLGGPKFSNVIKAAQYPDICSTVHEIITEMRAQKPNYQAVVRSLFFTLLLRLHRLVVPALPSKFGELKRENIVRINPAMRHIAEHFSEDVELEHLANLCNLSLSHFRKVFREATGIAPFKYLIKFRMNAAQIMLEHSKRNIIDIAYSCGYSTLSCFNRTFKSTFGMSPSAWRKSAKQDNLPHK
ncbi:MAG: helix-turn-helix transcriptional regulator [Phycisphaeraceae bacterium]|nr:helix-turn-helix transcriptional regulator [Phycisphaeraceae bacterium]